MNETHTCKCPECKLLVVLRPHAAALKQDGLDGGEHSFIAFVDINEVWLETRGVEIENDHRELGTCPNYVKPEPPKEKEELKVSIPMCYLFTGTNTIGWSNAVAVESAGKVRFADGGWCPIADCFLTEEQCLRHHKLPPKNWAEEKEKLALKLEDITKALRMPI